MGAAAPPLPGLLPRAARAPPGAGDLRPVALHLHLRSLVTASTFPRLVGRSGVVFGETSEASVRLEWAA